MAIVKSSLFPKVSGRLGNTILYEVGGQLRHRSLPGRYHDQKSPEQTAQRTKVKSIAKLYHHLSLQLLVYWKQLAIGSICSGYNLFMRENIRHLSAEGEIVDFSLLKICKGELLLPEEMSAKITAEGKLKLNWEMPVGSDQYTSYLQIAAYTPTKTMNPKIRILESTTVRKEAKGYEYEIPAGLETPAHFYAFFKSRYTNDVSDSCYLCSSGE